MGNRASGNGEELPMPYAQCPKRRGDYPSPPTLGMEFPVAFNESGKIGVNLSIYTVIMLKYLRLY
ncbi:hypothetical protein [Nostoc sp.]